MSEIKENISFNDFMKLDIRIGVIIEAEKIPESNKLIKMVLDFGEFKRQIVAGIATKYSAEELKGKQIPVVVNLEPKKMMGYESQGMIMAIGDKEVDSLIEPIDNVENGSLVH